MALTRSDAMGLWLCQVTSVDLRQPEDCFVPKQLGRALDLGAVRLSPAAMVRRRARLSAAVRLRCHAVRHSHGKLTGASVACEPQVAA